MVDITLCTNEKCNIREICERFVKGFIGDDGRFRYFIPSTMQSYAEFQQKPDGTCDYQLKIKG